MTCRDRGGAVPHGRVQKERSATLSSMLEGQFRHSATPPASTALVGSRTWRGSTGLSQSAGKESWQREQFPPRGFNCANSGQCVVRGPSHPGRGSLPQENSTTRSASAPARASSCSRKSDTCGSQGQGSVTSLQAWAGRGTERSTPGKTEVWARRQQAHRNRGKR